MNDERDLTRTIVDRLSVPARAADFVERVGRRAAEAERREIRRWRAVSYTLGAIAVAALASTGALLAATLTKSDVVDVTVACRTELKGDRTVFNLGAAPTGGPELQNGTVVKAPPGFHPPYSVQVATADHISLLTASSGAAGYELDRTRCRPTKQKLALTHRSLSFVGTYKPDDHLVFATRCIAVGRIVFRAKIENDDLGVPTRVQVMAIRAKTGRPLAYVDWTRTLVRGWALKSCEKWPDYSP